MSSDPVLPKRARKAPEMDFFGQDYNLGQRRRRAPANAASSSNASASAAVGATVVIKEKVEVVTRYIPPSVVLSPIDKSSSLVLSPDHLECTGCEGGYRMARATHGVHAGAYFWEVEVLAPLGPDAHVRIGWSTRQGDLQSFVGYDKYSYGYRDVGGSKCHKNIRNDCYGESFGEGDIIGCYLRLDDYDPRNNEMRFYKNGVDQGPAFTGHEILSGVYMPAVSLFMRARVRLNFGPSFILKYNIGDANAVSEVQPMSIEDRREHDLRIGQIRAAWMAKRDSEEKGDKSVDAGLDGTSGTAIGSAAK